MLKLAFCGDDCNACPRYIATQSGDVERLKEVAAMWKKAGWRGEIVPPEEMVCYGCASVKWCRYDNIRKCAQEKGIDNCGICQDYPCKRIEKVFEQTESYAKECEKSFSKGNYGCLYEAFFSKRKKLNEAHEQRLSQIKKKLPNKSNVDNLQ